MAALEEIVILKKSIRGVNINEINIPQVEAQLSKLLKPVKNFDDEIFINAALILQRLAHSAKVTLDIAAARKQSIKATMLQEFRLFNVAEYYSDCNSILKRKYYISNELSKDYFTLAKYEYKIGIDNTLSLLLSFLRGWFAYKFANSRHWEFHTDSLEFASAHLQARDWSDTYLLEHEFLEKARLVKRFLSEEIYKPKSVKDAVFQEIKKLSKSDVKKVNQQIHNFSLQYSIRQELIANVEIYYQIKRKR